MAEYYIQIEIEDMFARKKDRTVVLQEIEWNAAMNYPSLVLYIKMIQHPGSSSRGNVELQKDLDILSV